MEVLLCVHVSRKACIVYMCLCTLHTCIHAGSVCYRSVALVAHVVSQFITIVVVVIIIISLCRFLRKIGCSEYLQLVLSIALPSVLYVST